MGFFRRLFGLADDSERIAELADEVGRYADRFDNAKDHENAALARGYAERISKAETLKLANMLYAEFLAFIGREDYDLHRPQDYDPNSYTGPESDNETYSDDS